MYNVITMIGWPTGIVRVSNHTKSRVFNHSKGRVFNHSKGRVSSHTAKE